MLGKTQIGSIIEADGLARPVGDWPEHYIDPMHELDGVCDRVHRRVQDGASGLSALMAGLDVRCGIILVAWDDANDNAALRPELVVKARATEIEYFKSIGVYDIVARSQIDECGGKRIDTRWIDTNKADELNPEYRSRHVVREFNSGNDDSLYASTPHSNL